MSRDTCERCPELRHCPRLLRSSRSKVFPGWGRPLACSRSCTDLRTRLPFDEFSREAAPSHVSHLRGPSRSVLQWNRTRAWSGLASRFWPTRQRVASRTSGPAHVLIGTFVLARRSRMSERVVRVAFGPVTGLSDGSLRGLDDKTSGQCGGGAVGGAAGQGVSVVGVLRRDQLLGTCKLPLMTRVTTTLGECGSVIPCCLGPRTNR